MDREEVERVHKHAKKKKKKKKKKRRRPISSHLDRPSLVNKEIIIWDKTPKSDLKGKPVKCKNQWCVLLYPDWVNAEIQSFDWFTFERGIV